jgi:hypothetical protein
MGERCEMANTRAGWTGVAGLTFAGLGRSANGPFGAQAFWISESLYLTRSIEALASSRASWPLAARERARYDISDTRVKITKLRGHYYYYKYNEIQVSYRVN